MTRCNSSLNCSKWTIWQQVSSDIFVFTNMWLVGSCGQQPTRKPFGRFPDTLPLLCNHLLSTAANSNARCGLHFNSPGPNTHSPCARKPPGFSLFCPLISALSLSLYASVSWHSRAVSQMTPHALNESRLLPWNQRAKLYEKNTVKKRRIPHMAKVCSACWGLIKERVHKKSISWQAPVCSRKNTLWL